MSATLEYLIQQLKELNPYLDTRVGTGARDIIIGPMSNILSDLKSDVDNLLDDWTATDADSVSEDIMDQIASVYMVGRDDGSNATVTVRLYFSTPTDFSVRASDAFTTGDGLIFYPEEGIAVSANALTYDSATSYYYYDISCEAESVGSEYVVAADMIVSGPSLSNLAYITNPGAASGGTSRQTNAELLETIQNSISGQSMETVSGINSIIDNNFSGVNSYYVAGFGDLLMERDVQAIPCRLANYVSWRSAVINNVTTITDATFFSQVSLDDVTTLYSGKVLAKVGTITNTYDVLSVTVSGDSLTVVLDTTSLPLPVGSTCQYIIYGHSYYKVHRGNKIDIWASGTELTSYFVIDDAESSNLISSSNDNIVDINGSAATLYFPMTITRVVALDPFTYSELATGNMALGSDFSITSTDLGVRGSTTEDGKITINILDSSWTGLPVKVEYSYDSDIISIQDYINDNSLRSPAVDVLARKMYNVYVDASVVVPKGPLGRPLIQSSAIESFMGDYFNYNKGPFGISGTFSFWDMWNSFVSRLTRAATSIDLTFSVVDLDGNEAVYTTDNTNPQAISINNNCMYYIRTISVS